MGTPLHYDAFLAEHHPVQHPHFDPVAISSGAVAMAAGIVSHFAGLAAQVENVAQPQTLNQGGLYVAAAGLVTSVGSIAITLFKMGLDQKRWEWQMGLKLKDADHERVEARHNLAGRVETIAVKGEVHGIELDRLKEQLSRVATIAEGNRRWMIAQNKRHGDALPEGFDSQEFGQVKPE